MRLISFLFLLVVLFFSCKKVNDPAFIMISPNKIYFSAHPGDVIAFNISCSSNSNLSHLKISVKTETTFSSLILDSALSSKNFDMTFQYKAPVVFDTTRYTLFFTLSDVDGNSNTIVKVLTVSLSDRLLIETAGHEIFSHLSQSFDGFNLSTLLPVHSQLTDSANIHFRDASVDSVDHNTLSRKWVSPAKLKFVKFNGFNYANATYILIKNAFRSGVQDQYITNLSNGDIIITKLGNPLIDTGFVAIKIVNILDSDSTQNDKYIFNVKK